MLLVLNPVIGEGSTRLTTVLKLTITNLGKGTECPLRGDGALNYLYHDQVGDWRVVLSVYLSNRQTPKQLCFISHEQAPSLGGFTRC